MTPSGVDLRATGKALDLLRRARAVRGAPGPPACWCRAGSTGAPRSAAGSTRRSSASACKVGPAIRQRSAHVEAFEAGAWIGAHAAGSPAHREIRVLKDRMLELLDEDALRSN